MWFFGKKKQPEEIETVFCDHISTQARKIFADADFDFASTPLEASLIWLRTKYRQYYERLSPYQLINHLPNQRELIEKGPLAKNIRDYTQKHPKEAEAVGTFHPESYLLYDSADRARFFAQLPMRDDPERLWILKPTSLSKGRGMKILWDTKELRKTMAAEYSTLDKPYVIQRYITNPLLLDGKKSEMRLYWLIANLDPLAVMVYPEGTVRLNTLPYSLDDLDNPLVHVTNAYQQKSHPDYDPSAILKWSFAGLRKYLAEQMGADDADFVGQRLVDTAKGYLRVIAKSAYEELRHTPRNGLFFALYGVDLILDENLKMWVSEVQKGPGLSHVDPVKKRVIPPMFEEAIRIQFEVRRRRILGQPLHELEAMKRYQWVIRPDEGAVAPLQAG